MNTYQQSIKKELSELGREEIDSRHIEAYMRLEHGTLDALSKKQFEEEIFICAACVDASTYVENEALARSYGL